MKKHPISKLEIGCIFYTNEPKLWMTDVCDIALKIGETMELKRNPQPSKKQMKPPFPPTALKTTDRANIAIDIINILAI